MSSPARDNDLSVAEPDFPDGGYGWVCVFCTFLIQMHVWGINGAYAVFLSHYLTHDLFKNTPAVYYALVGGLGFGLALLVAPVVTILTRKLSTRIVLNLGVLFETSALVASSFVKQPWQLLVSQGLCFGVGIGFLFNGTLGIPSQWFRSKRSLANGIAAAGSGVGGLLYSLASDVMIHRIGLDWAFRILAIVSGGVNLICASLLRERGPRNPPSIQELFSRHLFKNREFLLYVGWAFWNVLGYSVLLFSLPSYSVAVGLSEYQGSIVGALFNLGQSIGRVVIGLLSDRFGRINAALVSSMVCGILCLVFWVFTKTMVSVCIFATLSGTVAGTIWAVVVPVGIEVVGSDNLPACLNTLWIIMAGPACTAEIISLQLRDQANGSDRPYLKVQLLTGFSYIGGATFLIFLRWRKVVQAQKIKDGRSGRATSRNGPTTSVRGGVGLFDNMASLERL